MKNQFKASQGFSLIELLLVLAIIAALAVAAFVIYPRVQAGRAATYEAQVLSSAQASVKGLFQSNNFRTLTNTVANQADIFPESMQTDAATITNQFSGAVTIAGASNNVGAAPAAAPAPAPFFRITYASVPSEVCMKLGSAASANFSGILVDAVVIKDPTATPAVAFDEAALVTACNTDAPVDMTFVSN